MSNSLDLTPPSDGEAITLDGDRLIVPDHPIVPFIEGDGRGPDIWQASVRVFDAAVSKAFDGVRHIAWFELLAGERRRVWSTSGFPRKRSKR